MFRRFLLGIMVLSLASVSWAGVPDLDLSTAVTASPGASLFSLPNGQGAPFTAALGAGGVAVDATITLTLVDNLGEPIFGYPFDDMWLETSGGSLVYCSRGTAADASTDSDGIATWTNPVEAGNSTAGEVVMVMIAGSPLSDTIEMTFNSADMNGDLVVNLLDFSAFGGIFFSGSYDYAADFNFDGIVNLLDLNFIGPAIFAQVTCP